MILSRLVIFFRERFPLQVQLPFAVLTYVSVWLATGLYGGGALSWQFINTVGCFTAFGMALLMRIFDELKDREVDPILFPERPFGRGAVLYRDIEILGLLLVAAMFLLNWFFPVLRLPFILMLLFSLLTFRWFFMKDIISKNLIYALVTHQPTTLFVLWYIVQSFDYEPVTLRFEQLNVILFTFFMPVFAWEVSRKIKAQNTENDYVTYSKIMGPRIAAMLALSGLIWHVWGMWRLLRDSATDSGASIFETASYIVAGVGMLVLIVFFRFILQPNVRNLIIRQAVEVVSLLNFVIWVAAWWWHFRG